MKPSDIPRVDDQCSSCVRQGEGLVPGVSRKGAESQPGQVTGASVSNQPVVHVFGLWGEGEGGAPECVDRGSLGNRTRNLLASQTDVILSVVAQQLVTMGGKSKNE